MNATPNNGKISIWKKYYYDYLQSILDFLVPKTGSKLVIREDQVTSNHAYEFGSSRSDYVVASDVLGHIYDVQAFLSEAGRSINSHGRIVITQYNALWEPILRLATAMGARKASVEQNWLSMLDLRNFAKLSGLEEVKSGAKMLLPVYIPLVSWLFNVILANIWPFSKLGLIHYMVLRKTQSQSVANPTISIVVPARNESGTIEKIARELPELGSFTEIIFVEGNSTDDTYAEIERVAKSVGTNRKIKFTRQDHKGKGDAVRKGFDMATGDILAIYDADMTVPAGEVARFYEAVRDGKGDFINGSRLVYPLEKDSMRVLNFFGNKFFSLAFSWILDQPLKDTLCGTKVIWKKDYEKIKANRSFFGDFDPFGDFDLLFGAAKLNLKIIDLPIHYKQRIYGTTNISRWKHGWLLLRMTVFAARKLKFV